MELPRSSLESWDRTCQYLPCIHFPYNCLSVSVASCQTHRFAFILSTESSDNGPRSAEADTSTESFTCVGGVHQSIRFCIYLFSTSCTSEYAAFDIDVNINHCKSSNTTSIFCPKNRVRGMDRMVKPLTTKNVEIAPIPHFRQWNH